MKTGTAVNGTGLRVCGKNRRQTNRKSFSTSDFRPGWYAYLEKTRRPRWPVAPSAATGAISGLQPRQVTLNGTIQDLAGVSDELSNNLGFNILGQQPLAGAAARFKDFSARLRTFQGMTGGLSDNLATNADDLTSLTGEVQQIGTMTEDLAARVDAFDQAGEIISLIVGGIILGGILVAWLAIAAGFTAWVGWRLRKIASAEIAAAAGS